MTILHSTRYKWQPGVLIHSVYSCSWKYSTVFLQVCVRLLSRFPKCSLTTLFEETRRSRMSRVPANAQNNSSFWPFFLFTTYFGTVWKVLRHFTQVRLVLLSVTSNPLNLKYTLAIKAFTLTGGSEWSSIKKVLWILWRVIRNVKNVCRFVLITFTAPSPPLPTHTPSWFWLPLSLQSSTFQSSQTLSIDCDNIELENVMQSHGCPCTDGTALWHNGFHKHSRVAFNGNQFTNPITGSVAFWQRKV